MFNNLMTGTNRVLGAKPEVKNLSLDTGLYDYGILESDDGIHVRLFALLATIRNIDKIKIPLYLDESSSSVENLPFKALIYISRKQGYGNTTDEEVVEVTIPSSKIIELDLSSIFSSRNLKAEWELSLYFYTPSYSKGTWKSYLYQKLANYYIDEDAFITLNSIQFYSENERIYMYTPTVTNKTIYWGDFNNLFHYGGLVDVTKVIDSSNTNLYRYKASMPGGNKYLTTDIYNKLTRGLTGFTIEYEYTYAGETSYETDIATWYIRTLPSTSAHTGVEMGNSSLGDLIGIDKRQVVIIPPYRTGDDDSLLDLKNYLVLLITVVDKI